MYESLYNMNLKKRKTKTMVIRKQTPKVNIKTARSTLNLMKTFKYLGNIITENAQTALNTGRGKQK